MQINIIHKVDAKAGFAMLPDNSVDCIVTSPPYFGLRSYLDDDDPDKHMEIGLEESPAQYIARMVDVFREARRVLKKTGTCWINIGDSYANDGKWGGHTGGKHAKALHDSPIGRNKRYTGLKPKDLMMIPHRLAIALQDDGWWVRQDIVWHKKNPMPESVTDRCTKAHEYIFLLSKSAKYYFDHEAIKEPAVVGANGSVFHTGKTGIHQLGRASVKPRASGNKSHKYVSVHEQLDTEEHRTKSGLLKISDVAYEKRNRRSVWSVSTKGFADAHFAVFPVELIKPCIMAGCPAGGVVVDPFMGSGSTAIAARLTKRNYIGFDLKQAYVDMADARILKTLGPIDHAIKPRVLTL
ncbi:DNA-methyltransferase [Spirosoma sordidisoli]|uniref:Methyltransferase n=1 Tax=Spirosoma sordidisoli TaxID=2502893 RepID=A0A4Q2UK76_9BACT|nr:site-specific DNA-methyltransferase [Spirosoma sordidisoli]RYC69674.1 site-specific DNA-methyltransferase [Spirosoma sordidisoli]